VANFSFTTSGLTANFTDASTDSDGSIASRSWNFGDGSSFHRDQPAHTYASAGTYTVQLTVTDNGG
jgi:PKD repeat protein